MTRLLEVRDLVKHYPIRRGLFGQPDYVHALDGVSLSVDSGELVAVVGESGSGKTTLARCVLGLVRPTSGAILLDGEDLTAARGKDLRTFRRRVQPVFQDPYASLDPRWTVAATVREPLDAFEIGTPAERDTRVGQLLDRVGLSARMAGRRPHELSGGQRQRVGIAAALALDPELIVADEPVSALDVSVQAQVLNLLKDLQSALGLSYLFVSHNLAVVDYIADTIAVMCRGYIVEEAPKSSLFRNPVHPYTQALLAAVPDPDIDRPLDFAKLRAGRFSHPSEWPEPFRIKPGEFGVMKEIEPGHKVRLGHLTAREAA